MCAAINVSSNIVARSKFSFDDSLIACFPLSINVTFCLFLMFSIVFQNTELFMSLKKSFSKVFEAVFLRFVFFLIYGSIHLDL